MIYCKGCFIDAIHESDSERMNCLFRQQCKRAYKQGREDAIDDIITFKNSLDLVSEWKLMDACDIIVGHLRGDTD